MTFTTIVRSRDNATGVDWSQPFHGADTAQRTADALTRAGFEVTVEPVGPQHDTTVRHGGATLAEIRAAVTAGRTAFATAAPNAPAASGDLMRMIAPGTPVGEVRTLTLFRAFSAAYQAEADAEADGILTTD